MGPIAEGVPALPPRVPTGHKGTFGTVAVVGGRGGAVRMVGAPALAALGALRAGAGLVRLVMPEDVLTAGLIIEPSATGVALPVDAAGELVPHMSAEVLDGVLAQTDALVVGPGLGTGEAAGALALRSVGQEDVPVIVDADAINALSQVPHLHLDFRAPVVLTPHPGEYRRLAESVGLRSEARVRDRARSAEALAQRLGCVVVLKGAGTVVTDGQQTWTCAHSNPALATAGTGDVLAGLIAGLIAQHARLSEPGGAGGGLSLFEAACAGVEAHARAAEAWSRAGATGGMLARELAALIPGAVESLRSARS